MAKIDREIYDFEGFRIDISERRLSRDGDESAITPKTFDLLALLVLNQGHLLTKERIIEELWAGSFVEEANLNVNISALRKVLGDTAAEQKFIETVPRQGYRFVAVVTKVNFEAENARTEVEPNASVEFRSDSLPIGPAAEILSVFRRRKRQRTVFTVLAVAVLATISFAGWMIYRSLGAGDSKPRSIAVLPFRPLSQSASDEALEMGMTDALITKLSKVEQLTVRPTSSVRKFASQYTDAIAAGRELQVEAVLDGKVQKADNKVRVTVQLLRVADGSTLWSGSFDDFFTNIFAVQDSISERMAQSLSLKLSRKEQESIAKRYTENTEAYQLYLQAVFHHEQISEEGSRTALKYYNAAVEKDPDYALAYAAMVGAYAHLANLSIDRDTNLQKARDSAAAAARIDPELAEAHEALATIKDAYDWNWAEAEKEYLKAIELNPKVEGPHYSYSIFLTKWKRFDEAIKEVETARNINPVAVYIQNQVVQTLMRARKFDEAISEEQRILLVNPDNTFGYGLLIRAYLYTSKLPEAEKVIKRYEELKGPQSDVYYAMLYLRNGRKSEGETILRKRIANFREGGNYSPVGMDYMRLGEIDKAFEMFEKAFPRREIHLNFMNVEPDFDPIRNDPRYASLMRRIGLPQ